MSWVRFPHPALLLGARLLARALGRGLELLVGLAVDALQLVLGEVALFVLLLGAGLGVAGVRLVRHRVVARLLLLVGGARLLGQTEVLRRQRRALLGIEISHDVVLLASLRGDTPRSDLGKRSQAPFGSQAPRPRRA